MAYLNKLTHTTTLKIMLLKIRRVERSELTDFAAVSRLGRFERGEKVKFHSFLKVL
jgi:hypothetical protein